MAISERVMLVMDASPRASISHSRGKLDHCLLTRVYRIETKSQNRRQQAGEAGRDTAADRKTSSKSTGRGMFTLLLSVYLESADIEYRGPYGVYRRF